MKTQGEQVDCMARSGLLSLTTGQHYNSHTNELNTRPINKQIKHKLNPLIHIGYSTN